MTWPECITTCAALAFAYGLARLIIAWFRDK
jgi:hypothetical protein